MTTRITERRLEQLIAGACRVVGAGAGAHSVTVVTGHRLGYDAFARLCMQATAGGVDVTMEGDGTVLVRQCQRLSTLPTSG